MVQQYLNIRKKTVKCYERIIKLDHKNKNCLHHEQFSCMYIHFDEEKNIKKLAEQILKK